MGVLDRFINGSESDAVSFPIANSANPVEWGNLASAIVGSIAAGAASAAIALPNGYVVAFETAYGGAETSIENLVDAVFEPFVTAPLDAPIGQLGLFDPLSSRFVGPAMAEIWGLAYIEEFGLLAGPVAVVFVLVATYIVAWGAQQAIETFRNGGGIL